jgi:hypothetical protein
MRMRAPLAVSCNVERRSVRDDDGVQWRHSPIRHTRIAQGDYDDEYRTWAYTCSASCRID